MERLGAALVAATLATMMFPPAASGQTFSLNVVKDTFTDAAGERDDLFAQDEPISATLTLRNTGDEAITGIRGTLTFERGRVLVGSATWPDLEPGQAAPNPAPFVFSWSEGAGAPDPDCFIIVDEDTRVDPAEIVADPGANDAVATDPKLQPSDAFEAIPPGSITWRIVSDQGTIEHAIPFLAVCAVTSRTGHGSTHTRLAKTGGLESATSAAGIAFVIAGAALRRRAGRA